MTLNDALFSSENHAWGTPPDFFASLHAEFDFEIDLAALPENALLPKFYTPADNSLSQNWTTSSGKAAWLNPPYGREIGNWVRKAYESSVEHGTTVVVLVPSRTDTRWWQDWAMKADEIRLVSGRLKFVGAPTSAPFPSAVLVFRPRPDVSASPRLVCYSPSMRVLKPCSVSDEIG